MTDRRFDVIKFGGGSLFGPSDDSGSHFIWGVEVDWDQDGAFSGENEASRMTGINIQRGRSSFIRPKGQGFQPLMTGKARIELDNSDGRYDGFNADSPLYPYVTYGADVRVKVKDVDTGTVYPIFYGVISDIKTKGYGRDAKVTIYADDGMYFLREYTARVAVSTDITPASAIGAVLDYINWPSRWSRDLEVTSDQIKYFWASGNKIASTVIEEITSSFLGYFYISNTGSATYVSRTNVDTIGLEYSESDFLKDISLPQPYENNRNTTRVKAYPRTTSASTVIWQLLGDNPAVQPGSDNPEIIFADYTYNDVPVPAQSVAVSSSDYTMNTQPDGSGVDTSSDFTVALIDFGDTARLTITNGGAGVGYITSLQIKGEAIFLQNNADVVYPSTTTDLTQVRELFLDLLWQQDLNVATDFSTLVGSFVEDLHPYPTIKVENRAEKQFLPDLFDIVTVNMPTLGLSGESYRVAGIEHQSMSENCQKMMTRLYIEPYISFENFWIFPIADFGTDTKFGA
jgi:hypothetical protein